MARDKNGFEAKRSITAFRRALYMTQDASSRVMCPLHER